MRNVAARLSRLNQPQRLRAAGIAVLVLGIICACLFYYVQSRAAALTVEDLMPDFKRARDREIGIMMGHFGVMMLEWADALKRPSTEAFMIAAASALVARGCFRVAEVLEYDDQHPVAPRKDS